MLLQGHFIPAPTVSKTEFWTRKIYICQDKISRSLPVVSVCCELPADSMTQDPVHVGQSCGSWLSMREGLGDEISKDCRGGKMCCSHKTLVMWLSPISFMELKSSLPCSQDLTTDPSLFPKYPFYYYPMLYAIVFQVVFFCHIFKLRLYVPLSLCHSTLHILPLLSLFFVLIMFDESTVSQHSCVLWCRNSSVLSKQPSSKLRCLRKSQRAWCLL